MMTMRYSLNLAVHYKRVKELVHCSREIETERDVNRRDPVGQESGCKGDWRGLYPIYIKHMRDVSVTILKTQACKAGCICTRMGIYPQAAGSLVTTE